VVSASKSGATSPICSAMPSSNCVIVLRPRKGITYGPAARARGQRLESRSILVEKLQAFKEKVGTCRINNLTFETCENKANWCAAVAGRGYSRAKQSQPAATPRLTCLVLSKTGRSNKLTTGLVDPARHQKRRDADERAGHRVSGV